MNGYRHASLCIYGLELAWRALPILPELWQYVLQICAPWQLRSDVLRALQFGLKSRGWKKKNSRAPKNPPPSHVQEVPGRFHQAGFETSVQTQDPEHFSLAHAMLIDILFGLLC